MATILVTGCAGFIGSHITERLLNDGHNVVGVDNFDDYYARKTKERNIMGFRNNTKFNFLEGSILNHTFVSKLTKKNISIVNHQAAIAGVRASIANPVKYLRTNVEGTLLLLNAFKDVEKFVVASSSSVYGEVPEKELPVNESRELEAISPYALSKIQTEMWCDLFSRIYGTKTVSLRYFTVYGPRQRPDEALTKFIIKSLKGEPIEIYGTGEQTRDFTYVGDVVNANILTMEKGSGVYNISSGKRISVNELVKKIEEIMNKPINIKYIENQMGDVSHTLADITKARSELGYEPETTLEEGIKKHVEWVKSIIT